MPMDNPFSMGMGGGMPPPAKALPGLFAVFGGTVQRPQLQSLGMLTGQSIVRFSSPSRAQGSAAAQVLAAMSDRYFSNAWAGVAQITSPQEIGHVPGLVGSFDSGLGRAPIGPSGGGFEVG